MRISLVERTRGAWINFCGLTYNVARKSVARKMVRYLDLEWTARPRPGGFSVVTLYRDGNLIASSVAETVADLRIIVPGLAWEYMQELEAACTPRKRAKAGS